MQVKQLLIKLKQIGVDITSLQAADTSILEKITALESQLGDGGSVASRLEALKQAITTEFTNADNAVKNEIKKITDALDASIKSHKHSANDINETTDKQFVSQTKKTQYDENTIYTNTMTTVNSLGGIAAGTAFNNMPVKDVLTKLLYPYVAPQVSAVGTPNGGTFECGDNKTITNVQARVTKKSEQINKIELFDGSNKLQTKEDASVRNGGNFDFQVNIEVPSTNKVLTVKVTDAANKTYSANTGSFNFVYPYYYGTAAENKTTFNSDDIKAMAKAIEGKGNKTRSYTCNNERMVIAYPKSHGALKTIIDPNNFDVTATFGRQEVSVTGRDGNPVAYYVYVNSASTVSNFSMKFNY